MHHKIEWETWSNRAPPSGLTWRNCLINLCLLPQCQQILPLHPPLRNYQLSVYKWVTSVILVQRPPPHHRGRLIRAVFGRTPSLSQAGAVILRDSNVYIEQNLFPFLTSSSRHVVLHFFCQTKHHSTATHTRTIITRLSTVSHLNLIAHAMKSYQVKLLHHWSINYVWTYCPISCHDNGRRTNKWKTRQCESTSPLGSDWAYRRLTHSV